MAYPDTNEIIEKLLAIDSSLSHRAAERLGQYQLLSKTQESNIEILRNDLSLLSTIANKVPQLEARIKELEGGW